MGPGEEVTQQNLNFCSTRDVPSEVRKEPGGNSGLSAERTKSEELQAGSDQSRPMLLTFLGIDHWDEQREGHCDSNTKVFCGSSGSKENRLRNGDTT